MEEAKGAEVVLMEGVAEVEAAMVAAAMAEAAMVAAAMAVVRAEERAEERAAAMAEAAMVVAAMAEAVTAVEGTVVVLVAVGKAVPAEKVVGSQRIQKMTERRARLIEVACHH
jgi:hypothetical protein